MKSTLMLIALFALVSCASRNNAPTTVYVEVEPIAAPDAPALKTFRIVSGESEEMDHSIVFKELAAQLSKHMVQRGYQPAANPKDAEMIVYLSFGVGGPETIVESRNVPVYGNAMGQTYNVQNNWGQQLGTVKAQPNYMPTGYRVQETSYTVFKRSVQLHVYDAKKRTAESNSKGMIWAIGLNSVGESNDIRKMFPYMITVGAPYFGKGYASKFTEEISLTDPRVVRSPASN